MPLLRSSVEFSKRVGLDRLTNDAQPLLQPAPGNIDQGPGVQYDYGLCYDAFNLGVGADCSGGSGIFVGAALLGPAGMSWARQYTTETFPGAFQGFRKTTQADLVGNYYPIKIAIMRGGGGPDSHMNTCIDGVVLESNGDYGTCTLGHGAIGQDSNYWTDFYVYDGPIVEDTPYRCPMSYPRGLDYTSPISGASLKAAGISFVCRYVTPGGDLQWKCLLPNEFADLVANDIGVVFNWETAADMMLAGAAQGAADATRALNYIHTLPGVPANYQPVVYFSCDFDEAENQDDAVEAYLDGAATVLGGHQYNGIYGSYYVCQRMMNASKVWYMWQTEAWSKGSDGINIDSRVDIMQRNNLGYQTIDGIQCDINEAHTDQFGQYGGNLGMADEDVLGEILDQVAGELQPDGTRSWPQLGKRSMVDYLAQVVGPGLQQIQATLTSMQSKPVPVAPPGHHWFLQKDDE
jgi:Domain of unknown function (DUF1906)